MEYNPNIFSLYESAATAAAGSDPATVPRVDDKVLKQCGKFERKVVKMGCTDQHHSALAVFLVASVLETKNKKLLKEAKGLDDVVQVPLYLCHVVD